MESFEEELDKFNEDLLEVQTAMKRAKYPVGQVSGWDDDTEGIEEEEENSEECPEKKILWAAENGNVEVLLRLIDSNRTLIQVKDKDGYTPLHRACYNDHADVVDLLLSYGADISAETVDGWQPLHSACKWNNANCVAKLLENGANVNAVSKGGQTPLHLAASNSYAKDTLQLLLMHPDIQPNLRNATGEIAAELAQRYGKYESMFEITEDCINNL